MVVLHSRVAPLERSPLHPLQEWSAGSQKALVAVVQSAFARHWTQVWVAESHAGSAAGHWAAAVQPHRPVAASQTGWAGSAHTTGLPPVHAPPAHISALVHASPSSHGAVLLGYTQPFTASQASVVQGLPSSQSSAGPAEQIPA